MKPCASAIIGAAWLVANTALAQPVSAAGAQEAPPEPQSNVTVHAPLSPKAIREQAGRFVDSYAAAANPEIDQIGRWRDPVCVRVLGLPHADQATKIKARIETVARAVGLPAAPPNCKANVEIVFSDQPQAAMDYVARRRDDVLGYYHATRANKLKTVTRPIQSWYVTSTHSDGVDSGILAFSGVPTTFIQRDNDVIDDPDNMTPTGCTGSLTPCYTSEFVNVFIVADSKALDRVPLGAIADDMVMLALSQPRSLNGCNALPGVMDRFAPSPCPGRDAPDGLTPPDAAYLDALYSADLESRKSSEQADIARRMAKILVSASAAGAAGRAGSPTAGAKAP